MSMRIVRQYFSLLNIGILDKEFTRQLYLGIDSLKLTTHNLKLKTVLYKPIPNQAKSNR